MADLQTFSFLASPEKWPEKWAEKSMEKSTGLAGASAAPAPTPIVNVNLDWVVAVGGPLRGLWQARMLEAQSLEHAVLGLYRTRAGDPIYDHEVQSLLSELDLRAIKPHELRVGPQSRIGDGIWPFAFPPAHDVFWGKGFFGDLKFVSSTSIDAEKSLEVLGRFAWDLAKRTHPGEPPWSLWSQFPLWLKRSGDLQLTWHEVDLRVAEMQAVTSTHDEVAEAAALDVGEVKLNPTLVTSLQPLNEAQSPVHFRLRWGRQLRRGQISMIEAALIDETRENFRTTIEALRRAVGKVLAQSPGGSDEFETALASLRERRVLLVGGPLDH